MKVALSLYNLDVSSFIPPPPPHTHTVNIRFLENVAPSVSYSLLRQVLK